MSDAFDPYHKWLGIPPREQPPHHYRLLGIELFESDADVIDAAANQRMAYLQTLAAGEHGPLTQSLLNEVSAARRCLLSEERKAAYDAELRSTLDTETTPADVTASEEPPVAEQPDEPEAPVLLTDAIESTTATVRRPPARGRARGKSIGPLPLWSVIAAGIVLLVIVVIAIMQSAQGPSLVLNWSPPEREGAELFIDGDKLEVPASGAVEFRLEEGPHRLVLKRPGFVTISRTINIRGRKPATLTVHWTPVTTR